MFYRTRLYIEDKIYDLKQAVGQTKRRTLRRVVRNTSKLSRTSRRIYSSTKRIVCVSKDAVIDSLPGVSNSRLPSPPCSHLLLSNHAPTEEEAKLILKAITQAQTEVDRLTSLLTQNRKSKSGVKDGGNRTSFALEPVTIHRIDQANAFIHQHEGLLSIVRKLYTEILEEIFLRVALHPDHCDSQWRQVPMVWALSQTCHTWRTLALGMSSLWGCLPIASAKLSRTTKKMQLQYFSELLRRSGGTPLDLCIDTTYLGDEPIGHYFNQPAVDLLCTHAERWETVAIVLHLFLLPGLSSIKGRLTALKSLTLSAPIPPMILLDSNINIFEDAPQLTSVQIDTPFPSKLFLPYEQLRHYKEKINYPETQFYPAMNSCSVLETLTMIVLTDRFVFPKLIMPCLVQLHAEFQCKLDVEDQEIVCFDDLTLPSIQDIRISARADNMAPTLLRLLQNSSPCLALETLAIRFNSLKQGQLTELLWLTPSLVHLHTTMPFTSDHDIRNIADEILSKPPYRVLAPLLETCEFFNGDDITENVSAALNSLALSRCKLRLADANADPLLLDPPSRLKTLCISFSGPASWDLQPQQTRFEGWLITTTSFDLSILRDKLVEALPDLLYYGYHEQSGIRNRDQNEKVRKILAKIETFTVDDAKDIYASGVLYALKSIATCQCPKTKNGALAKKILDKWKPMTENRVSLLHRHWAMQGNSSLVYIPDDSELRITSPGDIVFGLKDDIPPTFPF